MAIITRQTGLLSAENWNKIYQTFREADFTAYDFETLRKSMIDYIKLNYAEDFNDFTESSEFIALIDLIAFLGQSLAFRTDLNARENFIDTAERRDSILKLARMISYNPKRSISASGYLKIDSVKTTEVVFDSDGIDLSNTPIIWDDVTNENWLEQFSAVINSALISGQIFGKPGNSRSIGGVRYDEYSINITPNIVPVYRFNAGIEGQDMTFEVVSASTIGQSYVYEVDPDIGQVFNILFKNDGGGNASKNTGFFMYFKQGELNKFDFVIDEMLPNRIVNVDINNINNNDVWLYELNSQGLTETRWKKVPSTSGVNVIYNNLSDRNLFQVNSRLNDQISLVFGDGAFAAIPQGNFRTYYRVSNGLTYRITPDEMRGILISLDYVSRYNRTETISFRASLQYTVANANARESIEEIRLKAPQQYYTQNRMVTGEDYNILPFTNFTSVAKVKAINRTSSGLSRYLDVLDTTGKYSSTNIFGEDGVLYTEKYTEQLNFTFSTTTDIRKVLRNQVIPDIINGKEMMHYFYATILEQDLADVSINPQNLINGETYTIVQVGNTNWTQFGAESGVLHETFIAENTGKRNIVYSVVNAGNTTYVFTGANVGNNIDFTLRPGDILEMDINAYGHPLWIKTARTTGNNFAVTSNITNNGTQVGTIIWDTINVAPGTYYYVCQHHLAMFGNITVESWGTGLATTSMKWNSASVNDTTSTGYFTYNKSPAPISITSGNRSRYIRPGAMVRFVSPPGYYFNGNFNLVKGMPAGDSDSRIIYSAVTQVIGDGTNNGQGTFTNGLGPVYLNLRIPTGAIVESVIPIFNNTISDSMVNSMVAYIESFSPFGLTYSSITQSWQLLTSSQLTTDKWWVKFEYSNVSNIYNVFYRGIRYVLHSPNDTNFFYDESLQIYDNENNSVIRDHIKILKVNQDPRLNQKLNRDYTFYVYKPIVRTDGYVENKSIYLTYADTNDDGVPDYPDLFERIVLGTPLMTNVLGIQTDYNARQINQFYKIYLGRYPNQAELDFAVSLSLRDGLETTKNIIIDSAAAQAYFNNIEYNDNMVFFELRPSYDEYGVYRLLDNSKILGRFKTVNELSKEVLQNFDIGQLIYIQGTQGFHEIVLGDMGIKQLSRELNSLNSVIPRFLAYVGRQKLYFQYRHNSPNSHRIDPSISNIVDIYMLTNDYNISYRQWVQDLSNQVDYPEAPTNTQLQVLFNELENYKTISDTIVFHSAVFKPLFGSKADTNLQAIFKVVKNQRVNVSDSDIKTSVIGAINDYFAGENWDFGETFYFSELSAYLHKELSPDIAGIIIVPKDVSLSFGSFYQINAEPHEILISAATVNDIEIISAITAAQLNQTLAISNRGISL